MTWLAPVLASVRDGVALAVQYNPLFAAGAAALAAALMGFRKAKRERREWAAIALAAGWVVGDGLRILARARDYYDGIAAFRAAGTPLWPGWTTLGIWALGSLALGYVVPALVGAAVGRRVTHGTGWLAAGALASALTLAISAGVGSLG